MRDCGLGAGPDASAPARRGFACTAVLFIVVAVCAVQHLQHFPPEQVDCHAIQRGQHERPNRVHKPGLVFKGLVLDVELVMKAQRMGLEQPVHLHVHPRFVQIFLRGQGALRIQEVVIDVHRAPPDGGRCAMQVEQQFAGRCPRGMGTAWVG